MFSNTKQSIPVVFQEIMRNHDERRALKAPAVIEFAATQRYRELRDDFINNLRPSAEKVLRMSRGATL